MGPGQAAREVSNSGFGSSDFDAEELVVVRSLAMANEALNVPIPLLPSLISASATFRPRRWWMSFPFLPLPETSYTLWRLYTAYGDKRKRPAFSDVATFAMWQRSIRRVVEMGSQ